jgi:hypothetical protein
VGPYEINVDLNFSNEMTYNSALINPANYQFDEGMYARLVDVIDGYNIRLWVELFGNESSFTLNIDSSVVDIFGMPITDSVNITPFYSTATMGNYNTRVRTWRDGYLIQEDSQRIYLAGVKGIDVFRKQTAVVPARWAQIFDSYGIDAMFVANFPEDLVITDTVPPFLQNLNPSSGGSAGVDTSIYFEIADAITAVEITSVTVYVNGLTVFAGGFGGWSSGYSGNIIIGYKQLNLTLNPGSNFASGSTVSVRVVASDLLGNTMDDTYSFAIGLSFGFGAFGSMPFGSV